MVPLCPVLRAGAKRTHAAALSSMVATPAVAPLETFVREVCVALGHFDVLVPQQLLDVVEDRTTPDSHARESVA